MLSDYGSLWFRGFMWCRFCRFFLGKNKVMMVALGRGVEDEYRDNLHRISRQLTGQRGLLFTNQSKDEVLKYVNLSCDIRWTFRGIPTAALVPIPSGGGRGEPFPVYSFPDWPFLSSRWGPFWPVLYSKSFPPDPSSQEEEGDYLSSASWDRDHSVKKHDWICYYVVQDPSILSCTYVVALVV